MSPTCASDTTHPPGTTRRYHVVDRFTIAGVAPDAAVLDLWCPIVPDRPFQRVVDLTLRVPGAWSIGRDEEHGNLSLHSRLRGPFDREIDVEIGYVVERTSAPRPDPACARPLDTPAPFQPALAPERFVEVSARTRRIAADAIGGATHPLERARRLYQHVLGSMAYDAAQQSWKGSTEHAIACAVGNCNDIHALFISLCRSAGIPARLVLGQALETTSSPDDCELCGYHCWAEFFTPGLGWVPADASCACKYGKDHLFGEIELNHVAWSVGRDILLRPPQRGERLLFFAGPYVEVDGRRHAGLQRGIRFDPPDA